MRLKGLLGQPAAGTGLESAALHLLVLLCGTGGTQVAETERVQHCSNLD
jgi:hypothetical protein